MFIGSIVFAETGTRDKRKQDTIKAGDSTVETIIERLQRYTEMNPGAPILFDDAHTKGITYAQLDDMSGRVYGWLKKNGIGREDCCYFQQKDVTGNGSGHRTFSGIYFLVAAEIYCAQYIYFRLYQCISDGGRVVH